MIRPLVEGLLRAEGWYPDEDRVEFWGREDREPMDVGIAFWVALSDFIEDHVDYAVSEARDSSIRSNTEREGGGDGVREAEGT